MKNRYRGELPEDIEVGLARKRRVVFLRTGELISQCTLCAVIEIFLIRQVVSQDQLIKGSCNL